MQPINYLAQIPQPDLSQSILGGLQAGTSIRQSIDQRAAQEQEKRIQQSYMTDMQAYAQKPTAQGAAQLALKYPKQAEAIGGYFKTLDSERQKAELQFGNQVYGALQGGRADIATQLLEQRVAGLKNSGQDYQDEQVYLDQLKNDPQKGSQAVMAMLGYGLASLDQKFAENHTKLQTLPADIAAKNAQAAKDMAEASAIPVREETNRLNINSQIQERAARLMLDEDRLASETEAKLADLESKRGALGDSGIKIVNDSTAAAVAADMAAGQSLDLADRLEKEGGGYGAFSSASEWLKKSTGNQDAMSAMRQEYTRLRNSIAVKSLPAGPATDKDIELALKGIPPETADARTMASFLRGVAKIQQREAVLESAKAEWANSVGHLGKAKSDIEVDGRKVAAGMSFTDFAKSYIDGKSKEQLGAKVVPGRSYMRFASPAPATPGGLGSGSYGIPLGQ